MGTISTYESDGRTVIADSTYRNACKDAKRLARLSQGARCVVDLGDSAYAIVSSKSKDYEIIDDFQPEEVLPSRRITKRHDDALLIFEEGSTRRVDIPAVNDEITVSSEFGFPIFPLANLSVPRVLDASFYLDLLVINDLGPDGVYSTATYTRNGVGCTLVKSSGSLNLLPTNITLATDPSLIFPPKAGRYSKGSSDLVQIDALVAQLRELKSLCVEP